MTHKHTPGPWWVDETFVFANGVRVADVIVNDEYELPTSNEQADANARLIAAAPELLDAIKRLTDAYFEEHFYIGGHEPAYCTYCAALAAIAKAEGR